MIYCVEDDESIQSLELYALQGAGFQAKGFADSRTFLEALHKEKPQLIILDVMLPGQNGVELLKQMKASALTREIPIIMATAKGAEYDKIQSLDLGADDYLVKPFGMMEMAHSHRRRNADFPYLQRVSAAASPSCLPWHRFYPRNAAGAHLGRGIPRRNAHRRHAYPHP